MAQLDAIRYEIRSLSLMNPGPMTRRLMENSLETTSHSNGIIIYHTLIYFAAGAFHFFEIVFLCLLLLLDNAVPEKQEEQKAKNVVIQVILLIWSTKLSVAENLLGVILMSFVFSFPGSKFQNLRFN